VSKSHDYEAYYREAMDAGNWFMFRPAFMQVMSPAAAVLAQHLINQGVHRNTDGWVEATADFIRAGLRISRHVQDKTIDELRRLGFAKTKLMGLPAKRFVKILPDEINSAVIKRRDKQVCDTGSKLDCPPCRNNDTVPSLSRRKKNTRDAASRRREGVSSSPDVTDKDRQRCRTLRAYAKDQGWIISGAKARWGEAAAALRVKLGAKEALIDETLDYVVSRKVTKPKVFDFAQLALPQVWEWLRTMIEGDKPADAGAGPVDVSDEARTVAKRCARAFRHAVPSNLEAHVQRSLDGLRAFTKRCRKFAGDGSPEGTLAKQLFTGHTDWTHADVFLQRWYAEVGPWHKAAALADKLVVSPESDRFHEQGRAAAARLGAPRAWDKMVKRAVR